jgi:hypothetical protein
MSDVPLIASPAADVAFRQSRARFGREQLHQILADIIGQQRKEVTDCAEFGRATVYVSCLPKLRDN